MPRTGAGAEPVPQPSRPRSPLGPAVSPSLPLPGPSSRPRMPPRSQLPCRSVAGCEFSQFISGGKERPRLKSLRRMAQTPEGGCTRPGLSGRGARAGPPEGRESEGVRGRSCQQGGQGVRTPACSPSEPRRNRWRPRGRCILAGFPTGSGAGGRAAPRNSDGSPSLRIQNAQPPGSAASSEVCVARGSGAAGGSGRSEADVPRGASPGAAGDRRACGGRAHGRSPRSSRVSSWRGRRGSRAAPRRMGPSGGTL